MLIASGDIAESNGWSRNNMAAHAQAMFDRPYAKQCEIWGIAEDDIERSSVTWLNANVENDHEVFARCSTSKAFMVLRAGEAIEARSGWWDSNREATDQDGFAMSSVPNELSRLIDAAASAERRGTCLKSRAE